MAPIQKQCKYGDLIAATGLVMSNWIQIVDFSACVVVKFDGWPRKTIGHFLYTTSSFVHHFKSICEVKLELQSSHAQFGSKLVIFFVLCDLGIRWMTSKNNRAPLLYQIKLCIISKPSVNLNWNYSPETLYSVKDGDFLSCVTLKFDAWPWKTIGHLSYAASSFGHHFIAIGKL